MDWYIRDIVIYGKDDTVRRVELEQGITIITGDSQTGKTVLIPIVDYCLGSTDCDIFVGEVRSFARWYAIRLQTPTEQIFLARQDPGQFSSSANMFIEIAREVEIPSSRDVVTNTRTDAVVEELSRRLGMMEASLEESPFDKLVTQPPSIRNIAPFLFQPQWVIANKDTLFYKADVDRYATHRQRLQRIFPYVIGAVNADYFRLRGDYDVANRRLRQLERQNAVQDTLLDSGIRSAQALLERARALGIAPTAPSSLIAEGMSNGDAQQPSLDDLRIELATILEVGSPNPQPELSEGTDQGRVTLLTAESSRLREEINGLRRELMLAEEMSQEAQRFTSSLQLQADRLSVIGVLPIDQTDGTVCPICHQPVEHMVPSIQRLHQVNENIRSQLQGVTASAPALSAHIANIRAKINSRRQELRVIESELTELYRLQNDATHANQVWAEQQRQLGAIRFYLESTPHEREEARRLRQQLEEQRRHVESLAREIAHFDVTERRETALGAISQTMSDLGKRLKLERAESALRLDIKNLTVVRDSPTGRPERLYEIGSGENWVGYHLVTMLALHTFFIRHNSPVPSVLFLDQPSQIYFPQERRVDPTLQSLEQQPDWDAIRNIYNMVFDAVGELNNRLQVVILDHVELEDTRFNAYNRIRWRDGKRLI